MTANLSPLVASQIYAQTIKFNVETPLRLSVQSAKTLGDLEGLWAPSSQAARRICVLGAILHSVLTLRSTFTPSGFIQDYRFGYADVEEQVRVFRARFGVLEGKTLAVPGKIDFYGVREYLKRVCYGNKVVHA